MPTHHIVKCLGNGVFVQVAFSSFVCAVSEGQRQRKPCPSLNKPHLLSFVTARLGICGDKWCDISSAVERVCVPVSVFVLLCAREGESTFGGILKQRGEELEEINLLKAPQKNLWVPYGLCSIT